MEEKKYLRHPDLITAEIEEDLVMLDIDKGKYYALNTSAKDIWNLLESEKTLDELSEDLVGIYDIDKETCQKETQALLDILIKKKVLTCL